MTNEKTLEEIFWKDGKFVKENGEEVKVESVGETERDLIGFENKEGFSYEKKFL